MWRYQSSANGYFCVHQTVKVFHAIKWDMKKQAVSETVMCSNETPVSIQFNTDNCTTSLHCNKLYNTFLTLCVMSIRDIFSPASASSVCDNLLSLASSSSWWHCFNSAISCWNVLQTSIDHLTIYRYLLPALLHLQACIMSFPYKHRTR